MHGVLPECGEWHIFGLIMLHLWASGKAYLSGPFKTEAMQAKDDGRMVVVATSFPGSLPWQHSQWNHSPS